MKSPALFACALPFALAALTPAPVFAKEAFAQEVFAGVAAHGVDTPFTLETLEGGVDFSLGLRLGEIEALDFIGSPAPYVIGVLNSRGDTSFAGGGLSWSIGDGPVYVRPAIGLVVHDGPELAVNPANGVRTDLGSRVLFEPEIAVGYRISDRLSAEASWMHISQGRIFDSQQNPGIDMIGVRLAYRLR